jgi:serine/threonine protein kinase
MLQAEQVLQERYQLKQQLGYNAGRQTWLAEDLEAQSNRDSGSIPTLVIVKLLAFNPQMQWEELKLFEREAQVLKNLNHPRIPQYRDYFSLDRQIGAGLPWFGLVQEYIPGDSLQHRLDRGQRFTETQARQIGTEVLNILMYLHELSPPVFHRDIKPSNLILSKNGQIHLVDFGAVQDRATAEGATFTVVGTSGYAPPEQLWGRAVAASDLYALGATLIHLLTGTAPAELPQHNLRIQFADRIKLNLSFIDWLEQLTQPAPERRYSTARQALEDLNASDSPSASVEQVKTVRQSTRNSVIPLVLTLELIVALLACIGLPSFLAKTLKSKQVEAKHYLSSMNRAQQAYYIEKNAFTNSIQELGIGINSQTVNYNYSVEATPKAVFNYGVSRQDNLKSYVGAVFVVPAANSSLSATENEMTTVAIMCEANSRGTARPSAPIYQKSGPACSLGTKKLG